MAKKIAIVGAGPGGLTAGMLLARKGYQVDIYEKDSRVGGRNQAIRLGEYTFDTGPTFLMLLEVLDEAFRDAGRDMNKLLDLKRLEPMYRLRFHQSGDFYPVSDEQKMMAEVEQIGRASCRERV